jgi:GT2 family glycosyltransferase
MVTAVVIPTLGGRRLAHCLDAVSLLDPPPRRTVVVCSGRPTVPVVPTGLELVTSTGRLGFAAAVNAGIGRIGGGCDSIALLNDDAVPAPGWLGRLEAVLDGDPSVGAVQGTVTDSVGAVVDGRGITLDPFGLPVQVDRGASPAPEPPGPRPLLAVSGTASLLRVAALEDAALAGGAVFDPVFGSYHEDLDLGLRLRRCGWRSVWTPGAWASHIGSATGRRLGWRHPWWVLSNRWRALAGNLSGSALAASLPRLLRGEMRAVRTLTRTNPRAPIVAIAALAAVPALIAAGLRRPSRGERLRSLPEG